MGLGYEINNISLKELINRLQKHGLVYIIQQEYPLAKHQCYMVHIGRNVGSKVKRAHRSLILN